MAFRLTRRLLSGGSGDFWVPNKRLPEYHFGETPMAGPAVDDRGVVTERFIKRLQFAAYSCMGIAVLWSADAVGVISVPRMYGTLSDEELRRFEADPELTSMSYKELVSTKEWADAVISGAAEEKKKAESG